MIRNRNLIPNERVIPSMFEKITLRIFFFCLVTCASLVLFLIWTGGPDKPDAEWAFKTAGTLFIVGLASFLSWLVTFAYGVRKELQGPPRVLIP